MTILEKQIRTIASNRLAHNKVSKLLPYAYGNQKIAEPLGYIVKRLNLLVDGD